MLRRTSFLLAGLLICAGASFAQSQTFELNEGDRVVFIGDGLFENELDHGYFEYALVTRWPQRRLTFRNIGWSGDTPAGMSRDHFTNPPTAYEHLMEQIAAAQPTIAFVGYGSYLGYEEAPALEAFENELNALLDTLDARAIRPVLISPVPHEPERSPVADAGPINERLERVAQRIAEIAEGRNYPFVDLFAGLFDAAMSPAVNLTDNGIHLNAAGSAMAAEILESELGLGLRIASLNVDVSGNPAAGSVISNLKRDGNNVSFDYTPSMLPLATETLWLTMSRLTRGNYTLRVGGHTVASATDRELSEGIAIPEPHARQAEHLREVIIEKNQEYFYQYRPQNETYLVGFREYEQGQNARELDLLEPLIGEKENDIGRLKSAQSIAIELIYE